MSAPMDVYIPPSFSYFVKRLTGVSVSTVRMTNLSQTTASAGDTIKVKFPTNAIVNLSSFTMYSKGYTTAVGCFPKLSQSLINMCRVSIGGQMISGGNCQEVGVLYNIGSRMQQAEHHTNMLTLQHLGDDMIGDDAVVAEADAFPIVIDDFPFFLSATPRYLHTGILPEMIVDIVLAPNSVMGGAGNIYHLKDIYFTIEVIQFDNDLYSKILETRLANGDTIEIPFLDAHYISKPNTKIIETQVSANAITKIFVVPRSDTYATQGDTVHGLTKPFVFSIGSANNATTFRNAGATSYWSIDNKMYPQQPATLPEMYQTTLDAFGDRASTASANSLLLAPSFVAVMSSVNHKLATATAITEAGALTGASLIDTGSFLYHHYISAYDNYLGRNAIFALNLEINEGADQRLISGYSSVGKNAPIIFNGANIIGDAHTLTMFVLVKRCLKVRAGQQIFLEM